MWLLKASFHITNRFIMPISRLSTCLHNLSSSQISAEKRMHSLKMSSTICKKLTVCINYSSKVFRINFADMCLPIIFDNFSVHHVLRKNNSVSVERTYTFPVFTQEFCQKFLDEIKHFEQSPFPKGRPNTMNKTGVLVIYM